MNNKSPHILNTSSNLLGFSFLVLTSIKGFGLPQGGMIDEVVSVLVILFAASAVFSFISMRTENERASAEYERFADYIFLLGLMITMILSTLLAFDFLIYR